ncbi:MAG: zf-HC2 domain-containing protein [Candidatus Eremiobacteraeota bacterium]|nr:zf-HC2 domain-containing protein [Candidatus Eremiobacteraeota bacterium]
MRCFSCEPLLDAFLEGTLRRSQAREVAAHVRECVGCDELLQELRVVDALLTTARPTGGVTPGFTAGVVSATRATQTRLPRRPPLPLLLLLYLVVAWSLAALAMLRSNELLRTVAVFIAMEERNAAALGAALRALAPATPLVAAAVTVVLLIDLFLLCALFYGYQRLRPLIAQLGKEPPG